MTINLEQIADWAANDWQVECVFEDHGGNASDADIGGINGWVPDNVVESATISVIDGKDDWHEFEVTREHARKLSLGKPEELRKQIIKLQRELKEAENAEDEANR